MTSEGLEHDLDVEEVTYEGQIQKETQQLSYPHLRITGLTAVAQMEYIKKSFQNEKAFEVQLYVDKHGEWTDQGTIGLSALSVGKMRHMGLEVEFFETEELRSKLDTQRQLLALGVFGDC